MVWLNYYAKEREKHKEQLDYKLTDQEAEIMLKKLIRHYHLPKHMQIEWTKRAGGARFQPPYTLIFTPNKTNILFIAHEIAHAIDYWKSKTKGVERRSWHNKRHARIQERVILYCSRRNYWKEETGRRLAPKLEQPTNLNDFWKLAPTTKKVIHTKEQLLEKRIGWGEGRIHRYELKVRMYERKLSRARRSVIMLKKQQEVK